VGYELEHELGNGQSGARSSGEVQLDVSDVDGHTRGERAPADELHHVVRPMAFCAWDGGYLATEAEWNYAATGGDQQRAYPWSNPASSTALDGSHASYNDGTNCVGDGVAGCALTDLVAVGTKPSGDGRWGQSDLAGNAWEWTLDWYATYISACTDCANLVAASYRVARGGGFDSGAANLRVGYRSIGTLLIRDYNRGVRCARSAP
jgi:formylglycine-generating enzyme required for sulfatase activity